MKDLVVVPARHISRQGVNPPKYVITLPTSLNSVWEILWKEKRKVLIFLKIIEE